MLRAVRTTAVMAATLSLGLGTAAAATPSTIISIPGQLVVPAPPISRGLEGLVGSASGIAYANVVRGIDDGSWENVQARLPGEAGHHTVGLSRTVSMVGDQLVGWSYWVGATPPELTAVSMSTGARQDLGVAQSPLDNIESDATDKLPRGTGTGWVDARFGVAGTTDAVVLRSTTGGAVREYPLPVVGTRLVSDVTADERGLAATFHYGTSTTVIDGTPLYTGSASYYLDFAGGVWTALGVPGGQFAFSPSTIAWVSHGNLVRVPRSDLSATPELRPVPYGTAYIAITDTASAWTVVANLSEPWYGPATLMTAPEPATTPATTVAQSGDDPPSLVALSGNEFAAAFFPGPLGYGVYQVSAGASVLDGLVDARTGDAAPIVESTGEQWSLSPDGTTATVQGVSTRNGALSLAPARLLNAPAGGVINEVAVDGARTAVVTTVGTKVTLTITGASPKPWHIPLANTLEAVSISGHRLLATDGRPPGGAAWLQRSRLLDLNRYGSHWVLVPDVSAISDHWLAYENNDGTVWLRDLARPTVADKRLAPPVPGSDTRGDHGAIAISGDWVTWTNFGFFPDNRRISGAYQISTGRLLALPFGDPAAADGFVGYADDQQALHLYRLATGTDITVAGALYASALSVSNEAMSYIDTSGNAVVVPIASLVSAHPRAVPVSLPMAKAPFVATFQATRPLSSWQLQVRSSKGKLVFSSRGAAPNGWVRVAWNGRGAHGKRLPAGAYRWTVTGKGAGGVLTASTGKGRISGVIHL